MPAAHRPQLGAPTPPLCPGWAAPLCCTATVPTSTLVAIQPLRLIRGAAEILPKHFGWPTVFGGRPKLERWWAAVQKDPEAARVRLPLPLLLPVWLPTVPRRAVHPRMPPAC